MKGYKNKDMDDGDKIARERGVGSLARGQNGEHKRRKGKHIMKEKQKLCTKDGVVYERPRKRTEDRGRRQWDEEGDRDEEALLIYAPL